MQIAGGQTRMIGMDGQVLATFPPGDFPKTDDASHNAFKSLDLFHSYVSFDFSDGLLPVKSGDNWTLYNQKGEIALSLGTKYAALTNPSDGIHRAYEPIPNKRGSHMIIYIDQKGKELFQGIRFWQGSAIIQGFGYAQLVDAKGPWVKLNANTDTYTPLPEEINAKIYKIKRTASQYSIAQYNSKHGYASVLMNAEEKVMIEPDKVTGKRQTNIYKVTRSLIVLSHEDMFYLVDTSGNLIAKTDVLLGIKGFSDDMVFLDNGTYFNNLVHYNLEPVSLPLKPQEVLIVDFLQSDFLGGLLIDTVSRTQSYVVFNCATKTQVGSTNKVIGGVVGDRFIEVDPDYSFERKLVSLTDFKGNVLYRTPVGDRIFRSIASTLDYKPTDIRHLVITGEDQDQDLSKYKKLESISFNRFNKTHLPESLRKTKTLKSLEVLSCDSLALLPDWLDGMQYLTELKVSDCKKISDLESIIESLGSLTYVYTNNYEFKEGFVENMKKERPGLRIDHWMSSGLEIMEESKE
jgi:Leucine-rich repeat (LRR) protein